MLSLSSDSFSEYRNSVSSALSSIESRGELIFSNRLFICSIVFAKSELFNESLNKWVALLRNESNFSEVSAKNRSRDIFSIIASLMYDSLVRWPSVFLSFSFSFTNDSNLVLILTKPELGLSSGNRKGDRCNFSTIASLTNESKVLPTPFFLTRSSTRGFIHSSTSTVIFSVLILLATYYLTLIIINTFLAKTDLVRATRLEARFLYILFKKNNALNKTYTQSGPAHLTEGLL